MLINSQTDPAGETWTTDACTQDGTGCVPFATGQMVNTAGAAAGTLFEAISSDGATATSPVWHGNVSAASPPSITGAVRANSLVTPVPATWVGGWTGDFDQTQLAACVTSDGGECTTLTDTHYIGGCPGGAAVIDPAFVGQYLRVADQRFGVGTEFAAYAVGSPYSPLLVWAAGPTTSVAIVGKIGPATGPPAADCSPPLAIEITPHGSVTIPRGYGPSTASLRATRGRQHQRITRTIAGLKPVTLRLSRNQLKRLGAGTATFELTINGFPYAYRVIHTPATHR